MFEKAFRDVCRFQNTAGPSSSAVGLDAVGRARRPKILAWDGRFGAKAMPRPWSSSAYLQGTRVKISGEVLGLALAVGPYARMSDANMRHAR